MVVLGGGAVWGHLGVVTSSSQCHHTARDPAQVSGDLDGASGSVGRVMFGNFLHILPTFPTFYPS